jgi:phenylalanyl-tRNA synthetase beta chain
MKFTLGWLRDHLDTTATLDAITEKLSVIGLEVEQVIDRSATLAAFRTARVIEATQHPNADRLRVCRVDTGSGEVTVVCGAPNARTGMAAVFAPPGAVIPGSGITLKVGEIRGVASAGMLVSVRELGLGDEHDGIIDLPPDTRPGLPYATVAGLDDPVIEIGVTPNRGDALAVRGIARDLAAAGLGTLKPWAPEAVHGPFSPIAWKNEYPTACPWILGRSIRRVKNGPSPDWLARRLVAIGLRPINALVDVTNYFAYDLGRPLHVFDADLISGGTLTVRRGYAGESFEALDGHSYEVGDGDIVIADASGVISLAGIMGGRSTAVNEYTKNVFLECALFDPIRIALTGRRHQLHSDARARFERGVDRSLLTPALDAATALITRICGGEASEPVSGGAEPPWRRNATLRFERLAGLSGADVNADEAVGILQRLGFTVQSRNKTELTVAVPPWRNDIASDTLLDPGVDVDPHRAMLAAEGAGLVEPECDLIEEVLRVRGLDTIPPISLPRAEAVPAPALSPRQARASLARRVLASRGLAECVTFSFMDHEHAALFGDAPESLRLLNPIAADLNQMRPSPLATLVSAALRNTARGYGDGALFEIGPGYTAAGASSQTQAQMAVGLRTGSTPRHWQAPPRAMTAMDVKADLWAVLAALDVPMDALRCTDDPPAWYHPGRAGTVRQGPKTVLAVFGELHPRVQMALGLDGTAVAFELYLDQIADPKKRRRVAPELSAFQPVRRDFAFVAPYETEGDAVLRAVRGADRAMITRATLFDVYEGDKLEAGMKSLGIEVVMQPKDKTLTETDIEAICGKIIFAVSKIGATLR